MGVLFFLCKLLFFLIILHIFVTMLVELERYFTQMGWYDRTRDFLTIKLEGGFEAFSGRASETWEYRWKIIVHCNEDLGIPEIIMHGNRFESLDDICARALKVLKEKPE